MYERGYERDVILELFRVIDWMIRLPDVLERQFLESVYQLEESKKMPYVTSAERFGVEKGIKTIATLQKLAAADDNIEVVWLYGSQIKGNATVNSDYDLAVACDQQVIAQHAFYCDELSYQWSKATSEKISIIDINKVPIPLAYSAINDGKVIYCRYPLRLHSEQQRIWSLWEAFRNEHERNRT